jgi:hypothetical protein
MMKEWRDELELGEEDACRLTHRGTVNFGRLSVTTATTLATGTTRGRDHPGLDR